MSEQVEMTDLQKLIAKCEEEISSRARSFYFALEQESAARKELDKCVAETAYKREQLNLFELQLSILKHSQGMVIHFGGYEASELSAQELRDRFLHPKPTLKP